MMRWFGFPRGTGFDAGVRFLEGACPLGRSSLQRACRQPWLGAELRVMNRYGLTVKSWRGGGCPEKAGELAGDCDGGDVGGLAPGPLPPPRSAKRELFEPSQSSRPGTA
jgi:hypothetical protein